MNPKQKFIDIAAKRGYVEGKTLFLQGTLNPEEAYPDDFVTYFISTTADTSHYDDTVHSVAWYFSVIHYSNDPAIVNTKPFELMADLRAAGFIPQGEGQDVMSDEPTHTGWAVDYIFVKEK